MIYDVKLIKVKVNVAMHKSSDKCPSGLNMPYHTQFSSEVQLAFRTLQDCYGVSKS